MKRSIVLLLLLAVPFLLGAGSKKDIRAGCSTILYGGGDPTEAGATDDFISFWDHGMSTTEGNEDEMFANPAMLQFHSMRCKVATAPGAGDDWTVVLRDDGGAPAAGTVTCVIDDANTICASTDSATVVVGSLINLEVDSSAGATDPTASALIECVICAGN